MQKNIGSTDRLVRIIVGIALIAFAFFSWGGIFAGLVGIILLATGLINFCPLYALLKFNTIGK